MAILYFNEPIEYLTKDDLVNKVLKLAKDKITSDIGFAKERIEKTNKDGVYNAVSLVSLERTEASFYEVGE